MRIKKSDMFLKLFGTPKRDFWSTENKQATICIRHKKIFFEDEWF